MAKGEPRYLSVVLSGGISLGAFHAGAVAQLGWFLARWNTERKGTDLPSIYVDVVSGASAGALTGAMLTHFIGTNFYEKKSKGSEAERLREFVRANHDAWCGERLSFNGLIASADAARRRSFFSNSAAEELAAEFLPACDPALPEGQRRLIYTCTLTSLEPIPFSVKLPSATAPGDHELIGKTRRDWITFMIAHSDAVPSRLMDAQRKPTNAAYAPTADSPIFMELASDTQDTSSPATRDLLWLRFRMAAIASGSFPIAWSPVRFGRRQSFYPAEAQSKDRPNERMRFTYMDGGVIDNMPLGRAAKVMRDYSLWTKDREGVASRAYVLIGTIPGDVKPDPVPLGGELEPVRSTGTLLLEQGGPIFESMREQSYFDDLQGARDLNKRLEDREQVIFPYLLKIAQSTVNASEEAGAIERQILEVLKGRLVGATDSDADAKAWLLRLEEQYQGTQSDILAQADGDVQRLYLKLMIFYDLTAGLNGRHYVKILAINPKVVPQSAFAGNFGGFFAQEFMQQDFQHGMEQAREVLKQYVANVLAEAGMDSQMARIEKEIFAEAALLAKEVGLFRGNGAKEHDMAYYTKHVKPRSMADVPADAMWGIKQKAFRRVIDTAALNFAGFAGGIIQFFVVAIKVKLMAFAILAVAAAALAWFAHASFGSPVGTVLGTIAATLLVVVVLLMVGINLLIRKAADGLVGRRKKA